MKLSQAKLLAKVIPHYNDELAKGRWPGNITSLSCWISNKGKITENNSTICYRGLANNPNGKNLLSIGARLLYDREHSSFGDADLSEKELANYITYVIERSPYKDAFLNKQAKSVIKHKWMFMDVSQPANYLVSALIAIRYTHEYQNMVKCWNDLVNAGVNEDLAWLIMSVSNYHPEEETKVSFFANNSGHTVLNSIIPMEEAKNFLNRKFVQPQPAYNSTGQMVNYKGFDALWSVHGMDVYPYFSREVTKGLTTLLNDLASTYKKIQNEGKSNNPFGISSTTSTTVEFNDFPKFILENQDRIMEAINNA